MDIYTEIILDHYQHPHNFGKLKDATNTVSVYNPLCGDVLAVEVKIKKGILNNISFTGSGCAISQAAMSMLTDYVKNKKITALKKLKSNIVYNLLGVAVSPARTKCALLGWDALHKILEKSNIAKST